MTDKPKPRMEVRLTDERGRTLSLTADPRERLGDLIDSIILDQAEGRATRLDLTFNPAQTQEPSL
jgi:hypothetical protein